ncbi:Polysaccharide export protein [Raphidiopsis brookii D9]|nr:Polysaccharide export protein [Raphidiopsis brookii D9]
MVNKNFWKPIIHSSTALVLLTTLNTAWPLVSLAQSRLQSKVNSASSSLFTDYLLGGGDRIRVNVFEAPEYTGEYQIPPGGEINMPLIGSIPVSGLTTQQAADEIARRYARFLKRPLISVNLLAPRPINIFVAGEVTRPGSYSLSLQGTGGNNPGVQYPTVLAALTTAEGVTLAADVTKVQLRRKVGRSGEQVVNLNLKEITQTGRIPIDITLRDGDTIFVPTATDFNVAESRNLFAASYAASRTAPRKVAIIGQVDRPGSYFLSGNDSAGLPTLMRAIQLSGGITSQADVRNIKIRRPTRTGKEQTLNINLWELLQNGDSNQDVVVQEGDTIIVPTVTQVNRAEVTRLAATTLAASRTAPRRVAIIGQVFRPGSYLVAAGGGNDSGNDSGGLPTVMRAIQLSGGITSQADVRNIKVRRPPTRTNKEQTLNINLWELLQTGDLDQDVVVEDGDTIIVPTATEVNTAEVTQLATTTLSPATIKVGVVGEVKKPGVTDLQPNSSLNQALLAAGGFNDARASSSSVDLVRLNPNGTVTKRAVKVDFSKGINEETNPILRNNDVIVVNRSVLARTGDALGAVTAPLAPIFSVISLFRLLGL